MSGQNLLGVGHLGRSCLAEKIADHGPVGRGIAVRDQVLEVCAHRVRDPAQQHDGDIALAAFELRDVALGNAGYLRQHLARHAAQSAHGADTLAKLFEEGTFGIGMFGHDPAFAVGYRNFWKDNAGED